MIRNRRENFHSIYIFLFMTIALFLLQMQDEARYHSVFAFDAGRIAAGEVWRLFTYQFLSYSFFGSAAFGLFITLMVLYVMGSALEEEWGTLHFVSFYLVSTFASAAISFLFGFTLLGSFFLSYSLLFAYAHMFPEQTFYILFVIPVKVRWIAWILVAFLALGVVSQLPPYIAASAGAVASFAYYYFVIQALRIRMKPRVQASLRPEVSSEPSADATALKNTIRFDETRAAVAGGDYENVAAGLRRDIVPGVNICPPADFKPNAEDRYCVRCEGFAECTLRSIDAQRALHSDGSPGTATG